MSDIEARLRGLPPLKRALLERRLEQAQARVRLDSNDSEARAAALAAFVVAKEGCELDSNALEAYLAERLPDYMVPKVWSFVTDLPRTSSGKVDKKALPEPAAAGRGDAAHDGPRSSTETALTRIWEEVLGVDSVGRDENFFELGGDSLLSIRIISRAAAAGIEISPKQFFDHPTVAGLATLLDADRDDPTELESALDSLDAERAEALLRDVESEG